MVFHREDRGSIIPKEISYMIMMLVPTHIVQQEMIHLSGYCLPSLIRKFTKLTSDVCKGVFDDC